MDPLDRERLIKFQKKYEDSINQDYNLLTQTGLKWIEILETEFDKRFLELDLFFNQLIKNSPKIEHQEEDEKNQELNAKDARHILNEMSNIFAQLCHKTFVVFDQNTKLEKDLDNYKKELRFSKSECKLLERKLEDGNNQLINFNNCNSLSRQIPSSVNSTRLSNSNRVMSLSNVSRSSSSLFNYKCNYLPLNDNSFSEVYAEEQIRNLRDDNVFLKKLNISLKSELFGARLAMKYLNKELSGRIQQIQILSKSDLTKLDQSRLWSQIETEIHLSRHKTVIKACRGRGKIVFGQQPNSPPESCDFHNKKINHDICVRKVLVKKKSKEGLGISITGGREYGVPIIISEIMRNTPAARSGKLYIGDSILSVNNIDLNDLKHEEAAKILLNQTEDCELECVFVLPEFDENETENEQDCSSRYCYFDSRIMYNAGDQDLLNIKTDSTEFKKGFQQNESDEDSFDDNISSITNTFNSPSKLYPGGAKPLFTTNSNSMPTRNLIKEVKENEIIETFGDEMSYDRIKLKTLDGSCQIFYKNKSTIIN